MARTVADWNVTQYLKFEDERTRPPRDLLAQVPLKDAKRVVDLGCGPGNSTELLVERFPDAETVGVDSSPSMLKQARERLPKCRFVEAKLETWSPEPATDLLFANAVFQWLPEHPAVLQRLLQALPSGGVLAVQMPDNVEEPAIRLMREVASAGPWSKLPAIQSAARSALLTTGGYYDSLRPHAARLDIWHTVYNHVMAGPEGIVEWFRGSSLQPYLAAMDAAMGKDFIAAYTAEVARHYAKRVDGKVLLPFPRLFILAVR
jgi:trans-aconitate 2-methyltransferase